ncbi:hypothetical protein QJQ45_017108, partial [Haematococcus lacustris]
GRPMGSMAEQLSPAPSPTDIFIPTQESPVGRPAARTAPYNAHHCLSTVRLHLETGVSRRALSKCRQFFVSEQCVLPNPHRPGKTFTVGREFHIVSTYMRRKTLVVGESFLVPELMWASKDDGLHAFELYRTYAYHTVTTRQSGSWITHETQKSITDTVITDSDKRRPPRPSARHQRVLHKMQLPPVGLSIATQFAGKFAADQACRALSIAAGAVPPGELARDLDGRRPHAQSIPRPVEHKMTMAPPLHAVDMANRHVEPSVEEDVSIEPDDLTDPGVNGTSADPGALTQPEMRSEVLSMEVVHDPAPEQAAALQPAHKDFVPELLKVRWACIARAHQSSVRPALSWKWQSRGLPAAPASRALPSSESFGPLKSKKRKKRKRKKKKKKKKAAWAATLIDCWPCSRI